MHKFGKENLIVRTAGISLSAILFFILACPSTSLCRESDSLVAVVPIDYAFGTPKLDAYPGFVLSADRLLVISPRSVAGVLLATEAIGPMPSKSALPLWITPGEISHEVASEVGINILFTVGGSTIFEAHRDRAYGLLANGYFVVEIDFRPVSELKQVRPGYEIAQEILQDRPLTESRKRFVKAVSDSVDPLRIRETIYYLNYDPAGGEYRSRFAPRPELRQDITPYVREALSSSLAPHGGTVWEQEFIPDVGAQYADGDSIFVNIIGEKRGTRTSAYYIICAHYDAIAVREPGWDWQADPAPGADDNATGVAAMLECARLLTELDLDVGVTFIAFSGEELGLLGSKHYVSGLSERDSVIGVINVDMVGYVEASAKIQVAYDWRSKWLSDQLEEMAEILEIEAQVEAVDLSTIRNSDHASFWAAGIPANMLVEELEDRGRDKGPPISPYYHSLGDTLGNLNMNQVADNVRIVVAFLSRFAPVPEDSLSDLYLTEGSIEWDWAGRDLRRPPVAGDSVTVRVRALNMGASMLESEPYSFEIWEGERGRGRLVHTSTPTLKVLSGQHTDLTASWQTREEAYGDILCTFVLLPVSDEVESDIINNSVQASITIMSQTVVLENLHVYPNPIYPNQVTDPSSAKIVFEISHPEGDFDGIMEIRIYDVVGGQIGYGSLERSHTSSDINIGRNEVDLSRFLSAGLNLPPGLYLCFAELRLIGEAGSAAARSRFAVVR